MNSLSPMPAKLSEPPPHGTRHRYQWRQKPCRCKRCRKAHAAWHRAYRAERRERDGLVWFEPSLPLTYGEARP
jgi:hypothetical protein